MPSLQLGVDVVLIFVVVSPLDGGERLASVSQLSTDVNICVCTTRDSSLLPRCRVQTTTVRLLKKFSPSGNVRLLK